MIDETTPEINDDMSDEERIFIETRSRRQPEYTAPGYNEPKPIDGVILRGRDSLIYSYVTEDQIDISELDSLTL